MCGIVAYNGVLSAADFLIDGISQLEYRGYDSVGIALQNNNESKVLKEVGRVKIYYSLILKSIKKVILWV